MNQYTYHTTVLNADGDFRRMIKPSALFRYVEQAASALLALPENALVPALEALDDDLIARHLSPGGSADLLSLALFLDAAAPETWL